MFGVVLRLSLVVAGVEFLAIHEGSAVAGAVAGATIAVITAIGLIWKKILKPFWRLTQRAEEALPVLVSIAEEFAGRDGQPTLGARLTKLGEDIVESQKLTTTFQEKVIELANLVREVDGREVQLDQRVQRVEDYLHQFRHEWRNFVTIRDLTTETIPRQMAALQQELAALQVSVVALADLREIIRGLSEMKGEHPPAPA